jgi:hypothetical protein
MSSKGTCVHAGHCEWPIPLPCLPKACIPDTSDLHSMQLQEDTQVELDKKRNALFALQLLITTVTMGFSFVAMVAGIFGMNLHNGYEENRSVFLGVTGLSCGLALAVVVSLMAALRYNGMLFLRV